MEERLLEMRRMTDPAYLPTISMSELYQNVYQGRPPIIDGLLCSGTYLFAGAPKVGKSFLVAQLAYHVSTGQKLHRPSTPSKSTTPEQIVFEPENVVSLLFFKHDDFKAQRKILMKMTDNSP